MQTVNYEYSLLYIENTTGDFSEVLLSKDEIFDYECKTCYWYVNFTKQYLSENLIKWLEDKEFEVKVIRNDCKLRYYIKFNNHLNQLEFKLKYLTNEN